MTIVSFIAGLVLYVITAHLAFSATGSLAGNALFISLSALAASLWLFVVRTSSGATDIWFKALVWDSMIFAAYFLYPIVVGIGNISPIQILLAGAAFLCILGVKLL